MSRRPLILVADDSEDIRNLFGIMLKSKYDVRFAIDSNEALAGADTEPLPDLILLDIEMPHLDGYEVCARLKANPALAHIPVIFVTGRTDAATRIQCLAMGAAGFVVKPFHARDVLSQVRQALERPDLDEAADDRVAASPVMAICP